MLPFFTNIGAYIKTSVNAYSAELGASATVNGTAVQLEGPSYSYKSAQMCLDVGTLVGSPTGVSVVCQLEQSADGSTDWTNYTDLLGHGTLTITAGATQATQDVIVQGAQQYIRLSVTNTLTGGSTPTAPVIAVLVLGGTTEYPAV